MFTSNNRMGEIWGFFSETFFFWKFQKLWSPGIFHSLQSLEFIQNCAGEQKTSSEREFFRQKCPVEDRHKGTMARLVPADKKARIIQITTLYNFGDQKSITGTRPVKPSGGWAATAEDHISFYYCYSRTGVWGFSGHRLTDTGKLEIGKMTPLLSL